MTPQATGGLYTSASLDERSHELIVKVINNTPNTRPAEIKLNGIHPTGTAKVTTLQSADLSAENSFDHPTAVAPESSALAVRSGTVAVQLRPFSVNVYRIPAE